MNFMKMSFEQSIKHKKCKMINWIVKMRENVKNYSIIFMFDVDFVVKAYDST